MQIETTTTRSSSPFPSASPSSSKYALIRSIEAPINFEASRSCQWLNQEIRTLCKEFERFKREDFPLFQSWSSQKFGKLNTRIRSLKEEIHLKETLLQCIGDEVMQHGVAAHVASQRVISRWSEIKSTLSQSKDTDCYSDLLGRVFDRDPSTEQKPLYSKKLSETEMKTLKETYRFLVKVLHPDFRKQASQQLSDCWHEIQQSYQAKDLKNLLMVRARVEVVLDLKGQASTKNLLTVRNELAERLRLLQNEFQKLKDLPAWGFAFIHFDKLALKETYLHTKELLQNDGLLLRVRLSSLKRQLKQMSKLPKARKTKLDDLTKYQLEFEF